MGIITKNRKAQHSVALFNGKLKENKPLSGSPLYSNLIYWANVEANEEGAFPMHPHEGIEILTFVFEGGLEHYDSASGKWTALPANGVQHIKAGSGVFHSEKYWKGSRAFQIWFDPDFSKSLNQKASYTDFQSTDFQWLIERDVEVMNYVGSNAPIQVDASGVSASRYIMKKGKHNLRLDENSYHSIYVMNGMARVDDDVFEKDTFAIVNDVDLLSFEVMDKLEIFVLSTPASLDYELAYE
ncbi:pirin family protein [Aureibacter tunicatorum]|uniref:Pirin N-terminal domain-containing protein n=1 Tax=Aureibacter tunicatorum TaxID=866807 RepID=A0AAE4BUE5_9BACT|nr:pirin family protein [Aureibacter tunicatorum]MDR6240657.1 hypothetical protein [Aureibacter tunicatorum]BDD07010.1 hypothetical protein AUTU_44930 [Aureibacter tunicatorum]